MHGQCIFLTWWYDVVLRYNATKLHKFISKIHLIVSQKWIDLNISNELRGVTREEKAKDEEATKEEAKKRYIKFAVILNKFFNSIK